jgi:hypothetical protein
MGLLSQVEPQEKKKTPKGRAKKRITYTRRFVNVTLTGGKRKVGGFLPSFGIPAAAYVYTDEPQPNLIDSHIGGIGMWIGASYGEKWQRMSLDQRWHDCLEWITTTSGCDSPSMGGRDASYRRMCLCI